MSLCMFIGSKSQSSVLFFFYFVFSLLILFRLLGLFGFRGLLLLLMFKTLQLILISPAHLIHSICFLLLIEFLFRYLWRLLIFFIFAIFSALLLFVSSALLLFFFFIILEIH